MKIKSFSYYILLIVIMLSVGGCKNDDQTRLQADWTSKDPIAIPFNARNNEQKLGNLVVNPSFETGKIYYEESNVKSYDINGWKKVGQNIQWVNSDNGDWTSEDVYHGNHAIKIERKHADETETTGDGIISDFIKVIPGNYSLKLHLKLKDICPNQSRVGTKMYDAVNIRLQYFDKNRLPVSAQEHNPFSKNMIDNSFKALTLANFWYIDELGWGEIHGKTAYHPFYDGDIPDDARYVKLFIGLKGTGQMWVDDIDFRYTRQNFTMLERLEPYFDSSYLAFDKILPTPKILDKKVEILYCDSTTKSFPIIVIPKESEKVHENIAGNLKELISKCIQGYNDSITTSVQIVTAVDTSLIEDNQLVISLGKNDLYDHYKHLLPDSVLSKHKDCYYIQQPTLKNIIFINASNNKSFGYAFETISQLFNKKAIYYSANIIDYPDFLERAYLLHFYDYSLEKLGKKLQLFNRYKLNNTYFEWYPNYEDNYPFNSLDQLQGSNHSIMIDLVKLNSSELINTTKLLKYSNIHEVKSILLIGDYYQKYEGCNPNKVDFLSKKNMKEHLQFDHIDLLNDFNTYISRNNIEVDLKFLSPWNRLDIIDRGYGKARFYYYDLKRMMPDNISLVWTGGTYFSNSIDFAEFYRMSQLAASDPVLLDNSLLKNETRLKSDFERNYYAGKIRVQSLFEPYELSAFDAFYAYSGKRKIVINVDDLTELTSIRLLTAGNYTWSTKNYNPDKTLWIVLNKLFGRENAMNLIYFSDAYYGLKEICQKIELNGQQFKNTRIAKNFESQLTKYYDLLDKNLQNRKLAEELAVLKSDILLRYNELTANVN